MSNSICIGAASNERYFPGLIAMVTSLLLNTNRTLNIDIHIIDGGIQDASWDLLTQTAIKVNPNAKVSRYKLDLSSFNYFPKDFGGGVLAYARLLFPDILKEEQLIYIDADILIFKDIQKLWELELEGNIMCVCPDPLFETIDQDCSVYAEYGVDPKAPHFNTGVVKIDLVKWRSENITAKTIDYIIKHPGECKFWDQSALNIILYKKVKFIDRSNNFFAEHFNKMVRNGQDFNIHFLMSKKPWLYYHSGISFQFFYDLMNVLNIRLTNSEYIKSRNSNKFKSLAPLLMFRYFKGKSTFLNSIGKSKSARIAGNTANYWKDRVDIQKNVLIQKENKQSLHEWRKTIDFLKKV
jgi:lipopolysaccharide biosynthesis glycosyltransferase